MSQIDMNQTKTQMNGILCVYKEQNFTSFDVVAIMRKLCSTKKIGHGGTLDPMAEGVLPVFLGSATKAVDIMPNQSKAYVAGFQLGLTTDSYDITGEVLSDKTAQAKGISRAQIEQALSDFRGKISQLPPMYSAVKVGGKKLYELARKGVEIERQPRVVEISKLELTSYEDGVGMLEIACSKGTYVRSIIHDLGEALGVGGTMTSLVRTQSGVFTLPQAKPLSFFREKTAEEISQLLLPVEEVFASYPKIQLDKHQSALYQNGVVLDYQRISGDIKNSVIYRTYNNDNHFIGLSLTDEAKGLTILKRF